MGVTDWQKAEKNFLKYTAVNKAFQVGEQIPIFAFPVCWCRGETYIYYIYKVMKHWL
jgi:hypothetical protein